MEKKYRCLIFNMNEVDIFERVMATLITRSICFKAEYDSHGYNIISFGCTDEFFTLLANTIDIKPDNECGLGPKEEL